MTSILLNRFTDVHNNFTPNHSEIKNNTYSLYYLYIIKDISGNLTVNKSNKFQEDISLIYNKDNNFTSITDNSQIIYVEKFTTQNEIDKRETYINNYNIQRFYNKLGRKFYNTQLSGTNVLLYIGKKIYKYLIL